MAAERAYDPDLYSRLAAVERDHFWFQNRYRLIAWALGRYFPDARSFLDVGCGTGFVLSALRREFPGLELEGGDPEEAGLAIARERVPGIRLRQLDARHLALDRDFDVVGAFDVIEHIPEDEAALASIRDAVRPGGGLILTVPQHPRLWSGADEIGRHQRRYRRSELVTKLERAGLVLRRATSFVSLLLPAMVLSRLGLQLIRRNRDPSVELELPRILDRAAGGVLRIESGLIRAGVDLPAGGSLLAVAQRPIGS